MGYACSGSTRRTPLCRSTPRLCIFLSAWLRAQVSSVVLIQVRHAGEATSGDGSDSRIGGSLAGKMH
jgi:hypothetical protein